MAFFCFSLRIQPFYPFQIVVLVEGEIEGRVSIASSATWYQLAIFESDFSKSKFKMLVGLCPIPFRSASCDAGCAFVPNTSITKKDSLGLFHKGRILGYLRLSGLHFFSATLFLIEEKLNIFLRSKKLLHFFFRFAIVRIACFLFCQQLRIFCIQLPDLG